MKANDYQVLQRCVEEGIAYGVTRADKYADDPLTEAQRQRVVEQVGRAVMHEIAEWFTFDAPEN
jgi:hypothetical protein